MEKQCFKCSKEKPLSQFYKHKRMADGHLNKCKECTKRDVKEHKEKLREDPEWVEKEKERHRAKYYRLNYKEKHKATPEKAKRYRKNRIKKYPEKIRAKNRSSHICGKNGNEWHHWNYNKGYEKDLILMTKGHHNKAHRIMVYDQDEMLYRDDKGNLLDTKEKHSKYLWRNGVRIIKEKRF